MRLQYNESLDQNTSRQFMVEPAQSSLVEKFSRLEAKQEPEAKPAFGKYAFGDLSS